MQQGNNESKGQVRATRIISNYEMLKSIEASGELNRPPVATPQVSFPSLNKAIEGFMGGELVVITGATGSGKTLFAQTMTKDFCGNGTIPLWFTYEVAPKYFLRQFVRNAMDLQFYMPEELTPYSIGWVVEIIKRAKDKFETNVVFIDHLHYLFDLNMPSNPSLRIGNIVRILKRLAVKLDIVIFIICHTTKVKIQDDEEIGLHMVRDSGLVGCEADIAIFVYREVKNEGATENSRSIIKVCKSRRTGIMNKVIPTVKIEKELKELDRNK